MVPRYAFSTKGVGRHQEKLVSFEQALRDAKIAEYNIVPVSSIFPPDCQLVSHSYGKNRLSAGQIVPCVMSRAQSNEPHRLMAASIGIALPKDSGRYGYIAEHHSFGEKQQVSGDYCEDLAAQMLATTLGITDFDPEASWDERREFWKIEGQIVRTQATTQSATGHKDGWWTTVVAAVVLVP